MEERKLVLKMIEDGKITAEEGLKLLEAMGTNEASSQEEKPKTRGISTEVNWSGGEEYRKRARQTANSTANMFTTFIENTIQKIKDVDLDFNFGSSVDVDHIFHHRNAAPASLDLSLENGSIEIKPLDEEDVRIECEAKVYRVKDTDEARRIFLQESNFRADENKLVFHTKSKSMKVKATLYVPRITYKHIKLYTFNGYLSGEQLNVDTLDVNALNGALAFSGIHAEKVMAETMNGSIAFDQSTIDLLDAKTINGEIKLDGTIQDVEAETINGSITYEVENLKESGYVDLKATTGTINLLVPQSLRIEGKLKTNVGNYSLKLSDSEVLEEKKEFVQKVVNFIGNQHSSPRLKVNILTNTGSILVRDR